MNQSLAWGLLPTVKDLVSADSVVNASGEIWRQVAIRGDFDPFSLHANKMWPLATEDCRFVRCDQCQFWKESGSGFCRGRISMALYNGEGRRIDPRHILRPTRGQMMLGLNPEFGASPPSGPHERLLLVFGGEVQSSLPL